MAKTDTPVDFDSNLEAAGTFGRAQFLLIGLNFYVNAYIGWQAFMPVFATREVGFYCDQHASNKSKFGDILKIDNLKLDNGLFASYMNTTESHTPSYGDKCTKDCHEYVYEHEVSSIISEFDLACRSKKFLPSLSNSIYWVAFLISCFISGALSDRFGRKYVSLCLTICSAIATSITPLANDIYTYIGLRFVCGFCAINAYLDYIIMAEMMDRNKLSMIGMTVEAVFAAGEFCCILFGYLFQDSWRWQFVAMAVPAYIYTVIHYFLMPESARWLYSKNKTQKAEKILRQVAQMNKRDPSEIHLNDESSKGPRPKNGTLQSESEEIDHESQSLLANTDGETSPQENEPNIFNLFGTFHSAILTMTCGVSWFSGALIYYGITYDVQNIGGNIFVSSALMTLFEVPALFFYIAMDFLGRKKAFVVSILICSVACAVLPFTEPFLGGNLQVGFAVLGKFLSAGALNMLFVYTPEQFPTQLRSTGMTFGSGIARIAALLAPFVIDIKLGPYNCAPFIIFAFCGVIASMAVQLFGVETKGRRFITTVEEYEQMAKTKQLESRCDERENVGIEN